LARRIKQSPLVGLKKKISISAMDLEAQGIGRLPEDDEHSPNKVIFVAGALPGEFVEYQITQDKSKFLKGKLTQVIKPAVYRKTPVCPWYGNCGGCTMQHLDSRAQLALKQRVLEDNLHYLGKVKATTMLSPIAGPDWGYRYRTRLSVVNRSIKKGTILVGFHEPQNRYVSDMTSCEVLPQAWSQLLPEFRTLVMNLSIRDRIPQIELAMGDQGGAPVTAMVIRILLPLTKEDENILIGFAKEHQIWVWTQTQGPETVKPFYPLEGQLHYNLPEFGIQMPFHPTDFTQVNHTMNQVLVGRAIRFLDIAPDERVIDFFCGIGNFTLPIATLAREVMGIEGSDVLCQRAKENAEKNNITSHIHFKHINLFEVGLKHLQTWGGYDKWLIDPPRDGAFALVQALRDANQTNIEANLRLLPKRIVYVSCNPATLARDAGILVNEAGYELSRAGIMNMFPHTSHVESIAVFNKK
jgi:23S rRNA (uracil1939-C5)-methyltransferase